MPLDIEVTDVQGFQFNHDDIEFVKRDGSVGGVFAIYSSDPDGKPSLHFVSLPRLIGGRREVGDFLAALSDFLTNNGPG